MGRQRRMRATSYRYRVNTNSPRLTIRIRPATKRALLRAARAEDRSVGSMVERIISDWLAMPVRMAVGE